MNCKAWNGIQTGLTKVSDCCAWGRYCDGLKIIAEVSNAASQVGIKAAELHCLVICHSPGGLDTLFNICFIVSIFLFINGTNNYTYLRESLYI